MKLSRGSRGKRSDAQPELEQTLERLRRERAKKQYRHRHGFVARTKRIARSRAAAKTVAVSIVGALVVGIAAGGAISSAAAVPDEHSMLDSALYPQTVGRVPAADPKSNELSVTVGKAISITTDSAGIPSLQAFVLNTQVSGQGSGQLLVPVGTDSATNTGGFGKLTMQGDSINYNIDSSTGEVQNLHASGGVYKGQDAVSLKVEAWLNGNPIDPNDLYNISGNVKINYIIQNHTTREQEITYKNTNGEMVKTKAAIPVPFGGAFSTTFGNGWGDIVAPWAQTGISPTGQQLNGTAILFPPLGGVTQTLTVTARAQNATLPNATITAIPINLSEFAGGLILNIGNKLVGIGDEGANLVGRLPSLLLFFQQLLNKYATSLQNINTQYVEPILNTVNGIKINPASLNKTINTTAQDLLDFAQISSLNAQIDAINATAFDDISKLLESGIPKTLNGAASLLEDMLPAVAQLEPLLAQLIAAFQSKADLDAAVNSVSTVDAACTQAQTVNNIYGSPGNYPLANIFGKPTEPTGMGPGATALWNAYKASNYTGPAANLWTAMNGTPQSLVPGPTGIAISGPSGQAGTIGLYGKVLGIPSTALLGGAVWIDGGTIPYPIDGKTISIPSCSQIYDVLAGVLPYLETLQTALISLDNAVQQVPTEIPKIATTLEALGVTVAGYGKIFNNPNCPNTVQGLIQAGLSGILKNCGLAQAMQLLGKVNDLIATVVDKTLIPGLEKVKTYIPDLKKYDAVIHKYVPLIEKAVTSVPATMDSYAQLLGGFVPTAEQFGVTVDDAVDQIAILDASLLAMNARAANGDGAPYGNATGVGDPITLAAWQINMSGAGKPLQASAANLIIAVVLLIISAGVGTFMYLRRPHV